MDVNLKDLNREQLEAYAQEHYAEAIPDPKAYRTKGDLQKAVEAAAAGEPVPEPTGKRGGTTVTFKGCTAPDLAGTRSVRVGDARFLLDTPVPHVEADVVSQLQELDGHDFEFEPSD